MPELLKGGIESLSGMDMSDVRVHANSSKPAEVGALAYAQGGDIHLGPGQEKHLPHEAWHVVQQREGRVQPTTSARRRRHQRRSGPGERGRHHGRARPANKDADRTAEPDADPARLTPRTLHGQEILVAPADVYTTLRCVMTRFTTNASIRAQGVGRRGRLSGFRLRPLPGGGARR